MPRSSWNMVKKFLQDCGRNEVGVSPMRVADKDCKTMSMTHRLFCSVKLSLPRTFGLQKTKVRIPKRCTNMLKTWWDECLDQHIWQTTCCLQCIYSWFSFKKLMVSEKTWVLDGFGFRSPHATTASLGQKSPPSPAAPEDLRRSANGPTFHRRRSRWRSSQLGTRNMWMLNWKVCRWKVWCFQSAIPHVILIWFFITPAVIWLYFVSLSLAWNELPETYADRNGRHCTYVKQTFIGTCVV